MNTSNIGNPMHLSIVLPKKRISEILQKLHLESSGVLLRMLNIGVSAAKCAFGIKYNYRQICHRCYLQIKCNLLKMFKKQNCEYQFQQKTKSTSDRMMLCQENVVS